MIILGLDPGTATTGYGVIRNKNNIELIEYGAILTKANGYMPQRLCEIYAGVSKLLKKFKPDQVALESLFFFKNQKTVMTVSQARGVIMLACGKHKVPVIEYPPLRVKNILCNNGRADKKEMQEKVRKILRLKIIPKPDDAADALAAAICYVTTPKSDKSRIIPKNPESNPTNNSKLLYPEISYKINGILFKVYNGLGGGYQEKYYQKALESEFKKVKIKYHAQVKSDLSYKDKKLGHYFLDFIINDKIVLEIKVTPYFSQREIKQVLAYLNQTGLELGILASFTKNGVKTKRILRGY